MNWTSVTHFSVAEMIFLSSSCTGHVVLPSSNLLSLDRKHEQNEFNESDLNGYETNKTSGLEAFGCSSVGRTVVHELQGR